MLTFVFANVHCKTHDNEEMTRVDQEENNTVTAYYIIICPKDNNACENVWLGMGHWAPHTKRENPVQKTLVRSRKRQVVGGKFIVRSVNQPKTTWHAIKTINPYSWTVWGINETAMWSAVLVYGQYCPYGDLSSEKDSEAEQEEGI